MDEDYAEDVSLDVADSQPKIPGFTIEIESGFSQNHNELVLDSDWWLPSHLAISSFALIANIIFLITVIYNRKSHDLKTFVTAVITCVAVLDILDVLRVLPVLSQSLFLDEIFRHVYCSLGVFHELAVAIFIISLSIAVCVQAGKENKYSNNQQASIAQKILIPVVLILAAGAAGPFFLISYERLGHTCTSPFKFILMINGESEDFTTNLYSTIITVCTYLLPVLILPFSLPIASVRTCISGQCCISRYKQPIGELLMTILICIIYLGTIVGIILPEIGKLIDMKEVQFGTAPLLWELGNNAARPVCYFMTNPAVWEGLKVLCCRRRKKHQLVNEDDEETELALSPVTTV